MKQTRQVVRTIKQSIFLDVYEARPFFSFLVKSENESKTWQRISGKTTAM
jgi:hypothetical protein